MTRNHQVNLRLTFPERRAIHRAAKLAGLPASEWVRLAALAAAGRCPMCGVQAIDVIPEEGE